MIKKICCIVLGLWIGLASYVMIDLNNRLSITEEKVIEMEENILSLVANDTIVLEALKTQQEYNEANNAILELFHNYLS